MTAPFQYYSDDEPDHDDFGLMSLLTTEEREQFKRDIQDECTSEAVYFSEKSMMKMEERIACVIARNTYDGPGKMVDDIDWKPYLDQARAIIKIMRDPILSNL